MLLRQVAIQVVTFLGGVVLARTLSPEIFGVFAIASFLVATVKLLGDFGLAPSLVQRKEELDDRDLQVAFTLQQGLLTAVAVVLWVAAPAFAKIYPAIDSQQIVWLARAMAFTLFLQSWRSMSVLQMERRLDFKSVASIEIAQALSYQGIAVGLALAGFGVWALVCATFVRAVLGAALAYAACPWPVRFAWDRPTAVSILRFGLPFQFSVIVNSIGNWVTPLLVGSMIGPQGVGLVTWAGSNGKKPLKIVDSLRRVAFPHYSRIQDEPEQLARAYERYTLPPLLVAGLWLVLIVITAPDAVGLIYGDQWVGAVPALGLFAGLLIPHLFAWSFGTLLRATGRVGYVAKVAGVATGSSVVAALVLVPCFGILGVPLSQILDAAIRGLAFARKTSREVRGVSFRLLGHLVGPVAVALAAGSAARQSVEAGPGRLGVCVAAVTSAYLVGAWLGSPNWLRGLVKNRGRALWGRTAAVSVWARSSRNCRRS